MVLKGAPDTPLITLALGKLIAEHTDIPAGVVSVLTSSKVETGVVMTTDPGVDMITFTGSTPVGKAITIAASDTLKKTFLELGGKSACLVLDDESLDFGVMMAAMAAVLARRAGLRHPVAPRRAACTGSTTPSRSAKGMMEGLNVGDPTDPTNYLGPLINAKQREKVQGMVDRAVADGATVVDRRDGRPTTRRASSSSRR